MLNDIEFRSLRQELIELYDILVQKGMPIREDLRELVPHHRADRQRHSHVVDGFIAYIERRQSLQKDGSNEAQLRDYVDGARMLALRYLREGRL